VRESGDHRDRRRGHDHPGTARLLTQLEPIPADLLDRAGHPQILFEVDRDGAVAGGTETIGQGELGTFRARQLLGDSPYLLLLLMDEPPPRASKIRSNRIRHCRPSAGCRSRPRPHSALHRAFDGAPAAPLVLSYLSSPVPACPHGTNDPLRMHPALTNFLDTEASDTKLHQTLSTAGCESPHLGGT